MRIARSLTAAAFLLFIAMPAIPERPRKLLSFTRSFFIDGQWFATERSAGGDLSLIRDQLARQGWEFPASLSDDPRRANSWFSDSLRMVEKNAMPPSAPVPVGLHAEHLLRMESESGPVDLVTGSMMAILPIVRSRMRERGWSFVESGQGGEAVSLAAIKHGRETFLVLLDEKERKFLLVRRTN